MNYINDLSWFDKRKNVVIYKSLKYFVFSASIKYVLNAKKADSFKRFLNNT